VPARSGRSLKRKRTGRAGVNKQEKEIRIGLHIKDRIGKF